MSDPVYKSNPGEMALTEIAPYATADELGFKTDVPPFSDPRVRRAVVLAIGREALILGAASGYGRLTSGVITPDATWQLPPEVLRPLYARDVARARQLLAEVGIPNLEFELTVPTYKGMYYVSMSEQLQAQWKEAGITARLKIVDSAAYTNTVLTRGEFSAYLGNAGNRLSANFDLLGRYHSKGAQTRIQTRYNNPKLDDLIDQQKVLSRDPVRRKALFDQIQRTVIDDNVLVSLSTTYQYILRWRYVQDFYVSGTITDSPTAWMEAWIDK